MSGAPLEERKVVSVLFCDLVGFTATSEAVDPEDVRARLRPYHARLRDEVERFGGTVEKFIGDAVMAVFGAPVAHEDDAERAVRAGLRILEAIGELNEADPSLGLQVRIGVNTGEGVVALGARPELGEGIVAGDVVNTASRLQGVAPVDGVAVSEQTYRQTERVFEYEPLEPVAVKGKSEPLLIFRPVRARAGFGRDVIRTHTTPLVGRDLERSLLIGTFERADQQRSCQLVTLVGEPGVGKSRMCAELLRHVDAQRDLVRWRQGRCLPYGDGIAFWALGEIVKAECGILESDTPSEASAKLEQTIPDGDPESAWLLARLAPLVGAPAEPAGQEESFAAWRRFCEGLAAERTTVLVFEDLHWADPALLAFLEHLADWAEGVPVLLVCTARPELYERHPTFGGNARNAQRINLAPLSDTETAQLVSALLERAVLPAETQQALLEQAGGNPLYAEEFVRLLADRGPLGQGVQVPESVQSLISARLDTLPAERKSLLQDASVVGKVFWAGAVAAMAGRDRNEVELALHELTRKELVRPARMSSMEGEHEYGFWHVLVRDVCYGQIPRAARAARHLAAAGWIEEKARERAEDLADVLAYHYQAALELNQAAGLGEQTEQLQAQVVRYLALAGERALSLDIEQAERQLARALDLCPDNAPERASLLERWAQAAQQQGRLQEARQAFEHALDLYRAQVDGVAAGRVLTRLGNLVHRLGDPRCEEMFAEAVELLETQPAGPELVAAYSYAAGRRMFTDNYPEAIAGADRARALAAEIGLPEPALALHVRGLCRCCLGEADGVEDLRRALGLALEQGLGRETAVIHGNLVGTSWLYQGPQAGLDGVREVLAFCERRGIAEMVLQISSGTPSFLAELGQTEQALAEAGPLADRIEAAGDMSWLEPRALQLRLLAETGSPQHAPNPEPLLIAAREIGLPDLIATAFAAAARLLLAQGHPEHAQALVIELNETSAVRAAQALAPWVLPELLRTTLALGDTGLAQHVVEDVEPRTPVAEHALASARAQLAEADHRHADAAHLYREAGERRQQFGNLPERAYALLGQGRCLCALGDASAEVPLAEARDLFASMGYKPSLAEAEKLLAETVAKTA
ncbi:MAG TPA: adenylate/guanylate cyclase domain-containing protein [Gaiellaceae bacterium]|nr:adenylate/guanylate cyclase domain-containing protein [Gaiellaceae bacterium]